MSVSVNSSVFILIPVHNRKIITLACLKQLDDIGDLNRYQVVIIDDGSTDGTEAAIKTLYPQVEVLSGDGTLWWTGAIKRGMEYAIAQHAEYLIWLNDDCMPQAGAIAQLIEICEKNPMAIVGGQSFDPETMTPSYGGIVCRDHRIQHVNAQPNSLIVCAGLSGNFVCMPRQVVDSIGYPDFQRFPHYYGDAAYTHQAKRKGYQLLICGDAIAHCKDDHLPASWLLSNKSLSELWQERFTIKSPHYWKAHLGFYQEMFGWVGTGIYIYHLLIKFFMIAAIVRLLPYRYRIQLKQFLGRSQVA
jgi:GT2 family glycosyltransferase